MNTSIESPTDGRILMYHAVVERPLPVTDPCFITADQFEVQLALVSRTFDVVPLSDFRGAVASGRRRPVAAITFDDGFINNHTVAYPILRQLQLPATIFVCSDFVDSENTPWFCRLNRAFAETKASTFEWSDERVDLRLPEERAAASLRIQRDVKRLDPAEINAVVSDVALALRTDPSAAVEPGSPYRMLTRAAIAEMSASGLIEFGAHTRSHAILARLDPARQADEVGGSIEALGELTGRRARLFAYPNGGVDDYDATSLRLLREAGVEVAVTGIRGTNSPSVPPLELRRIGVYANFNLPYFMTRIGLLDGA